MTTPPPAAPEGGSVVVLRADDHDIVLRGLLASTPNVNADAEVVVIGPGCSDVLLEANELYAFHHNGFEATRAGRLTFRRNYVNSRNTGDEAWPSENATRGDHAFLLEETHDVIAENNVVESVHIGFAVVGRDPKVDAAPGAPVANNRVLGNVVLAPSGVGVRIDSRCNAQNPCPASRTVIDTEIAHTVVIGGAAGISNAGAVNTRIHDVTIRNAANGMLAVKEPQNVAVRSTWSTVRTVAVVQNTAFKSGPDEAEWLFDHCAAVSSSGDPALFVTFNGNGSVKDRLPPPPDLGPCLLARPNADLGANVLEQTKDGVLMPGVALWAPGTAAFLGCGAVKDGANGAMDGDSCVGAQARLNLSACALP
jgi:hypothetical protein